MINQSDRSKSLSQDAVPGTVRLMRSWVRFARDFPCSPSRFSSSFPKSNVSTFLYSNFEHTVRTPSEAIHSSGKTASPFMLVRCSKALSAVKVQRVKGNDRVRVFIPRWWRVVVIPSGRIVAIAGTPTTRRPAVFPAGKVPRALQLSATRNYA